MAGAVPLYGTLTILVPDSLISNSVAISEILPEPLVAKFKPPDLLFAPATNSANVL